VIGSSFPGLRQLSASDIVNLELSVTPNAKTFGDCSTKGSAALSKSVLK
jgi:hypothetical protein